MEKAETIGQDDRPRRMRDKKRKAGLRPYIPVILVVSVGLAITLTACLLERGREMHEIVAGFDLNAEEQSAAIERQINASVEMLALLDSSCACEPFEKIDRNDFRRLTEGALERHPNIRALEWIPRIPDSGREEYERAVRREGFPDFQITEKMQSGEPTRANRREEYFPVHFVEPYKGNEVALGYDLASNPKRLEALERARDSGEMAATARITLVQETGNQYGFLVFLPVYGKGQKAETVEERRRNLEGFVLGVFRIGDIVERALSYLDEKEIDVHIYDDSAPAGERLLYRRFPHSRPSDDKSDTNDEILHEGVQVVSKITIAGRNWSVACFATDEYIASRKHWLPWGMLAAGVLFTGLVAFYLLVKIGNTKRIEWLVEKRTRDLRSAVALLRHEIKVREEVERDLKRHKENLEELVKERTSELTEKMEQLRRSENRQKAILENSPVPMMIVDSHRNIVQINAAALALMERKRGDVLGRTCHDMVCQSGKCACPILDKEQTAMNAEKTVLNSRGVEVPVLKSVTIIETEGEAFLLEAFVDISERKRAEKEIEKLRQQIEFILGATKTGLDIIDSDFNLRYVDPEWQKVYGNPAGRKCYEYFMGRSEVCPSCGILKAMETKAVAVTEDVLVREGNRPVQVTTIPFQDENGAWLVAEVNVDITTRKQAEEKIRHLASFPQLNPSPVIEVNQAGIITYCNQAATDLLGKIGAGGDARIFLPEDMPQIMSAFNAQEKTQTLYREMSVKDRTFAENICFLKEIGALRIYALDITVRKQAEEALKKSERWLSTTMRSIGDAVIATDAPGRVTFMNPVAEELTGWEEGEAKGRPLEEVFNIVNEKTGQKAENPLHKVIQDRIVVGLANHTTLISRDGTRRPIDDSAAPIIDDSGQVVGAILVFRDVSERRQIESRLVHSEKMASIGQLAAGVAHEINNPTGFVASNLNTLAEYTAGLATVLKECKNLFLATAEGGGPAAEIAGKTADLWKECDVDYILEDLDGLIRESIDGAGRIKKIVADLKDFVRADNQQFEEVDINEMLERTINVAWNEIKYKADVVKDYGDLPRVNCLAGQIDQALLNIIVNAAQAIEKRGVITIKTRAENGFVFIEIADTGVGIPPEIQSKIFDPFFTTKPVGRGTGLGLNIAYNIISQHRGNITVTSEPGEGTSFTIALPVDSAPVAPSDGAATEAAAAAETGEAK